MKKLSILFFVILLPVLMMAQDQSKFGIKFTGFVKSDIYYDSRQGVSAREGHFYLYPMNESLDVNGVDINGKSTFNMLSIQTRLTGVITGPDAFGAKTSALIEGAFFGHTAPDINGFRLRHAFAKLTWDNTELLVGQFWHAMFITDCFPGTVSFNTGAPFQPFSRNPQIRFTQKFNDVKMIFTAMSQRDFTSTGPAGASTAYLRNNVIPELNLTLQYSTKGENGNSFLAGVGADYMSIIPMIESEAGLAVDEPVTGFSTMAFMKFTTKDITVKFEGVLGQNTTHLTMLGGYIGYVETNQFQEFSPIKTASMWTDIHSNGKKVQVGLFAGFTKNQGSDKDNRNAFFSRGSNIDYIYRFSPRINFNSGKMRFSGEIEYTTAAYGNPIEDSTIANSNEVNNLRLLIGVYYFF